MFSFLLPVVYLTPDFIVSFLLPFSFPFLSLFYASLIIIFFNLFSFYFLYVQKCMKAAVFLSFCKSQKKKRKIIKGRKLRKEYFYKIVNWNICIVTCTTKNLVPFCLHKFAPEILMSRRSKDSTTFKKYTIIHKQNK